MAIKQSPKVAAFHAGRANLFYDNKDYARAMEDVDEAIRLEPENSEYRGQRGYVWLAKKDFARAIADLSVAITQAPKVANLYTARGIASARSKSMPRPSRISTRPSDSTRKTQGITWNGAMFGSRRRSSPERWRICPWSSS